MEKYGAEVAKYQVFAIDPRHPDDKKLVASDLTLAEANELGEDHPNYVIYPM